MFKASRKNQIKTSNKYDVEIIFALRIKFWGIKDSTTVKLVLLWAKIKEVVDKLIKLYEK